MCIMGLSGGLLYFLAKLPFYQVMVGAVLILLILQPLIMRYSRAIWINLFVDYATINKNEVY